LALTYLWTSESGRLCILVFAALVLSGFTVAVYGLERRRMASKLPGDGKISDSLSQGRPSGQ
jgi:hypothetical protein